MEIRSVAHKALRRLLEGGTAAGLPAAYLPKIEAIVSFLSDAPSIEAVRKLAVWRAHQLTGDRKGT
jgi:proteic killer suppression protein